MKLFSPPVLGVDISYYQRVVGSDYNLPVFACRVHSGYREDSNFRANRDSINRNSRTKVKIAYIVPVQGMDIQGVVNLCIQIVPRDWVIMVDAESGAGFMGPGNNSAKFNDLRERLIAQWAGGNRRRVIGYANTGDWGSCWPQHGDVPMIVAKYSSTGSDLIWNNQVIGWQYSDGDTKWAVPNGYPRSAAGVGNCDMNVFGFSSGEEFAAWLGLGGLDSMTAADVQAIKDYIDLSARNNILNTVVPKLDALQALVNTATAINNTQSDLFSQKNGPVWTEVQGSRSWITWPTYWMRGMPPVKTVGSGDPLMKLPIVGRTPDNERIVQARGGDGSIWLIQGGEKYWMTPEAWAAKGRPAPQIIEPNDTVWTLPEVKA